MRVKFKLAADKRRRFLKRISELAPQAEANLTKATLASLKVVFKASLNFLSAQTTDLTGNLRNSGYSRLLPRSKEKNLIIGQVGYGAPHAHLVEFGTAPRFDSKNNRATGVMPALPFLFPAYRINKKGILRRFSTAMNKSIKDIAKK